MLSFRPKIKHPDIQGLYFVGASTHPGAGVPVALMSAKVTSELILENASEQGAGKSVWLIWLFVLPLLLAFVSIFGYGSMDWSRVLLLEGKL